jgi:hypothetical protein
MAPEMVRLDPAVRAAARRRGMNAAAFVFLAAYPAGAQEAPTVAQEAPKAPEYRIKAAFLYNFTLYTEWPATAFEKPESPIVLAIAGEDPFGSELDDAVRGKTVRGRAIEVRRYDQAGDVAPCHLLFLASSQARHLSQILRRFSTAVPLTVGETDDFTRSGGVIRFLVEENKIRFEVNTDAAARARLKISSKLLHLAKIVRDPDAPKDR